MGAAEPARVNWDEAAKATAENANKAATATTRANRPNQTTAAGTVKWTQDNDGNWTQTVNASPELKAATTGAAPIDWAKFGTIDDGATAREKATNAAWSSATSRLDPQWEQRESAQRVRLSNQGLDPNSAAARNANRELGMSRNDAYQQALSDAIRGGAAAGESATRSSIASRQQAIAEALRARGMGFEDIQRQMALAGAAPGFMGASSLRGVDELGATAMRDADMWRRYLEQSRREADTAKGIMEGVSSGASIAAMLSDERVKRKVRRLSAEVLPGVRFATWEWEGAPGRECLGVIAQDVEAVAPELVTRRADGLLQVSGKVFGGA